MDSLLVDPNAWSEIAGDYDQQARRLLTPFSEEAVRWAQVGGNDAALDVAAGPGTTTMLAAALADSVYAVDFAPEMIAQLRKNTQAIDNVEATVGDGQKLELEDERFTVAFSMFGLMFFPDPIAGLRELHRVLKPGGRVVISSWVPFAQSPMMGPLGAALQHAIPPQPDQAPPKPFAFEDVASLTAGLQEGGFEDVVVREFAPTHPIRSPEHYWAHTSGNLFVNHMRKQLGEAWPAIEARALEHLREALHDVTELAMPGLIAKGTKRA